MVVGAGRRHGGQGSGDAYIANIVVIDIIVVGAYISPLANYSGGSTADLPDLTGRTAVVTGANSGLGFATANALAQAGAHVVLAVRNRGRGENAAARISGSVEVRRLDLADLESMRAFAADWSGPLDLLINNAGVMSLPETSTRDGFETQIAINHLGPFALTNLLLPRVRDRVVTVSSGAHRIPSDNHIRFENLNLTGEYTPSKAYVQSKLRTCPAGASSARTVSPSAAPRRWWAVRSRPATPVRLAASGRSRRS